MVTFTIKIEMSKSKIENTKIENLKNPRLPSEEREHPTLPLPVRGRCPSGAKHSSLSFASKIRGDSKGCSRASNIWCIFVSSMVRSTLLFLLLKKFWGTLKGVQGPPTFDIFSCLRCWIWKLFCRPFSILFRSILAMITYFNLTDSIFPQLGLA